MVLEKNECVFCKIARGEISSEKIYQSKNFFVLNDVHPVAEGHCLIIPKCHFETLFDLPSKFGKELIEVAKYQGKRLIEKGFAEGIKLVQNNYEASGQVISHFHLHVIPEKNNFKRKKHV